MNKTEATIQSLIEAIDFIETMWLTRREPTWEGDLHEFMANIIDDRVTIYEVTHVLKSIAKGHPIEELENLQVDLSKSKIESVKITKSSSNNHAK
tara:strand:- start:226 stop:510 length:285 start_codon:yes stop_codon:yes gene_type:complete